MSVYTKLACFAGGALFGSFGIKLLSSKDAKKAYVHVTAAGLRMKDSVIGDCDPRCRKTPRTFWPPPRS